MPDVYKDPNPKPEIAIALSDDFTAFMGFMPVDKIRSTFESLLPEIFDAVKFEEPQFLKRLCHYFFNELDHDKAQLMALIDKLGERCKNMETLHQKTTNWLISQYGTSDVGILFTLTMNVVEVPKHSWFWIPPDVPHAYIKGELCECMINSDNVVRGGLTPKLKDIKTLLEILPFD